MPPYEHHEFVLLSEEDARGILRVLSELPLTEEVLPLVAALLKALNLTISDLRGL